MTTEHKQSSLLLAFTYVAGGFVGHTAGLVPLLLGAAAMLLVGWLLRD